MESGSSTSAELAQLIRGSRRRAWVRAVLDPTDGSLKYANVVVGPQPPRWEERLWPYPECVFASASIPAREFATVLENEAPVEVQLGPTAARVDLSAGNFSWRRRPAHERFDPFGLPWPTRLFQPALADRNFNLPNTFLVSRGVPSFASGHQAFNAFVFDDYTASISPHASPGQLDVSIVDDHAYIKRVQATPTSVDVWVAGRRVAGSELEVGTAGSATTTEVAQAGRFSFALPQGLGQQAWVWLKDDDGWLDYRSLSGWGGYSSPDVRIDAPSDPAVELSALTSQGEGLYVEYKQKVPDSASEKRNALKTVVAFANGAGGSVLFGVSDLGEAVGLEDLTDAEMRLADMLHKLVTPTPRYRMTKHEVGRTSVLHLAVEPNDGRLFALTLHRDKPEYFVRRQATTYYARADEIAAVLAPEQPLWPNVGRASGR